MISWQYIFGYMNFHYQDEMVMRSYYLYKRKAIMLRQYFHIQMDWTGVKSCLYFCCSLTPCFFILFTNLCNCLFAIFLCVEKQSSWCGNLRRGLSVSQDNHVKSKLVVTPSDQYFSDTLFLIYHFYNNLKLFLLLLIANISKTLHKIRL